MNNVLVLGTGLGSMVLAMRHKGYDPHFTLVDNDKVVLKWAIEFLDNKNVSSIDPICMDAGDFMEQNTKKYDLVFIDIFEGRSVPGFVSNVIFFEKCRDALTVEGHLAFNYIINDQDKWEGVKNICTLVFPGHRVINIGINRIVIV